MWALYGVWAVGPGSLTACLVAPHIVPDLWLSWFPARRDLAALLGALVLLQGASGLATLVLLAWPGGQRCMPEFYLLWVYWFVLAILVSTLDPHLVARGVVLLPSEEWLIAAIVGLACSLAFARLLGFLPLPHRSRVSRP